MGLGVARSPLAYALIYRIAPPYLPGVMAMNVQPPECSSPTQSSFKRRCSRPSGPGSSRTGTRNAALRAAFAAALLAGTLSTPLASEAQAEGFDVQNFNPMSNLEQDFFSTSSASVTPQRQFSAFLGMNYSHQPLVYRNMNGDIIAAPVSGQGTTNALLSYGILPRLDISLDIPLVVYQSGSNTPGLGLAPEQSFGLGDIRVTPRMNVLNSRQYEGDKGFALAFLLDTHLPTGSSARLQGGDFRVGPRVAVDAVLLDDLILAANLGYKFRSDSQLENLAVADTLGWNAAAEYRLTDDLRLTGEFFGRVTPRSGALNARNTPVEVLAGGKYNFGQFLLALGAGTGLSEGAGAPTWRAFFALGHAPRQDRGREVLGASEPAIQELEPIEEVVVVEEPVEVEPERAGMPQKQ